MGMLAVSNAVTFKCLIKPVPHMQPYQKVAPHSQTYAYPSYHQKLLFFQLLRPYSTYSASQRQVYTSCYPLCSAAEALAKGVLACKQGTDKNTKTTTTATTTKTTILVFFSQFFYYLLAKRIVKTSKAFYLVFHLWDQEIKDLRRLLSTVKTRKPLTQNAKVWQKKTTQR